MPRVILYISILLVFACKNTSGQPEPYATKPVEHIQPTKDQQERRAKSEAYCKAHNIPVYANPNALFVDPEEKVTIRTKDEVVDRALALCYIGLKSEGLEQMYLDRFNKDFRVTDKLTPAEKKYATAKQPAQQQTIDANWRYESFHVMLWALGFIDTLSYPNQLCNVASDVTILRDLTEQQFRDKAKLRSKKEILDQADLILRLDWACVDARVNNKPMPGDLNNSIIMERHHSLNWLISYLQQQWDDVRIDT